MQVCRRKLARTHGHVRARVEITRVCYMHASAASGRSPCHPGPSTRPRRVGWDKFVATCRTCWMVKARCAWDRLDGRVPLGPGRSTPCMRRTSDGSSRHLPIRSDEWPSARSRSEATAPGRHWCGQGRRQRCRHGPEDGDQYMMSVLYIDYGDKRVE